MSMWRRTSKWPAVACAIALFIAAPVAAQTNESDAERAAREIAAARERANAAADAYFEAEVELDRLQVEEQRTQNKLDILEGAIDNLRSEVEQVAVQHFISSGSSGIPVLTAISGPVETEHTNLLTRIAQRQGALGLDDYEELAREIEITRDELRDTQDDVRAQQEVLKRRSLEAENEVERLRAIEQERLNDEAVQAALAAQQAEQARQAEEQLAREAEAARAEAGETDIDSPAAAEADPAAGVVTPPSGGAVGGRTGGGGPGTNPRLAGQGYTDAGIFCPVGGPSGFSDTWGAPRSGGRRHQGVDMIAPTGTPLVAVVGGAVSHGNNALGGLTISLAGDNGNRYYYAHLSSYATEPGRVEPGQLIGAVGATGNAVYSVPHLHFEIRPGGGMPVNPYPSVRSACG